MPEREGFVPEESMEQTKSLDSVDLSNGATLTEADVESLDDTEIDKHFEFPSGSSPTHFGDDEAHEKAMQEYHSRRDEEAGINQEDSEKLKKVKLIARWKKQSAEFKQSKDS